MEITNFEDSVKRFEGFYQNASLDIKKCIDFNGHLSNQLTEIRS